MNPMVVPSAEHAVWTQFDWEPLGVGIHLDFQLTYLEHLGRLKPNLQEDFSRLSSIKRLCPLNPDDFTDLLPVRKPFYDFWKGGLRHCSRDGYNSSGVGFFLRSPEEEQ